MQWKGKNVTVIDRTAAGSESQWPSAELIDCNQFYVTLRAVLNEPPRSLPLSRVEVNFDNLRRRIQLEILSREPWDEEQEQHVRLVVGNAMTRDGQLLLKWLLIRRRIECGVQFVPEISIEVQTKQMDIGVNNGIVERQEEHIGLRRTYYVVSAELKLVLQRVLPEVLK